MSKYGKSRDGHFQLVDILIILLDILFVVGTSFSCYFATIVDKEAFYTLLSQIICLIWWWICWRYHKRKTSKNTVFWTSITISLTFIFFAYYFNAELIMLGLWLAIINIASVTVRIFAFDD